MELENISVLTGLDGLRKGAEVPVNQVLGEYIKNPETGLYVTDFDGCLIGNDFGVQCFEQIINNENFWEQWSVEDFSELLLPKGNVPENNVSYWDILNHAVNSQNNTISKKIMERATSLLSLHGQLVDLYEHIKKDATSSNQEEFSKLMQNFDEIVISLEGFFAKYVGNKIFSRLRFFAGKSNNVAKNLAKKTIKEKRLQINDPLFSIYKHLNSEGANGKIITTNLISFVREAVSSTILNQVFSEDDVKGTKLRANGKEELILERHLEGEAVIGPRKAQITNQQAILTQKNPILAAGDSPFGDGPMLSTVLRQGGVNIIPVPEGADVKEIAKKFERRILMSLKTDSLTDEQKQRMWYLESTNFIDDYSS